MESAREPFLERVRQALAAGHRAGQLPNVPDRGPVGYQGAGPDPVARFRQEFTAAGGIYHAAADAAAATEVVVRLVRERAARRVLLGRGGCLEALNLGDRLGAAGVAAHSVEALHGPAGREPVFAADVGITGVDYLIAETGSLAVLTRADQPRSLSLLPPVHIAVAAPGQIVPDLFDLFERLGPAPPSCVTLITGPSKTGDIELKLVTGVHGPGEVHLVLVADGGSGRAPGA